MRIGSASWAPIVLLLAACASTPGPRDPAFDPAEIDRRMPALIDSAGVPGLAIAVLRDGEVAWARGFGVLRSGSRDSVDASTVFEAASLSKPVFAYLALRLSDMGRLDLDRPLAETLPLEGLRDPRGARITARMVLSHTTGLPNELHPGEELALAFDPGTSFRYSGEGYAYLQRVLEHGTGEPLERLAEELVFEPLEMERTGFAWDDRFAPNAAVGHGGGRIPREPGRPRVARAPSSLHTSALDYARFAAAVVAGEGLTEASAREMSRAHARMFAGVSWGLGWALEETADGAALWHWGDNSNTGFMAFAILSPTRRDGVVWLANSTAGLSIAEPLLAMTLPGPRVRLDALGYERFDDPRRLVREELDRVAASRGARAALEESERLRARLPADRFDERLWNTIGYRMLERGRVAEAVVLFEENARRYPASANVHDSLGEALAAAGQRERAIASYRRSLELDPSNGNAVERLRGLGAAP